MNDGRFAVITFLIYCAFCFAVGWATCWIAMTGLHECSVEVQHTDHVAVHVTECFL